MNNTLGFFAAASVGYLVYELTGEPREGIVAAIAASLFVLLLGQQMDRMINEIHNII